MWLACSFRRGTPAPRCEFPPFFYTNIQNGQILRFTDSNSELLEELVSISETFVEGEGQRARALFKLSQIHEERGREEESKDCREKATALRDKVNPGLKGAPVEEAEFSKLCPWMLW